MSNYSAIVIKIDDVNKSAHPNADKLEIYDYNTIQILIQKNNSDYKHGKLCLYFPGGTQIADWFLREHNLYRKNPDTGEENKSGFFEENGRVKTIKLRGVYSQGFIFRLTPEDIKKNKLNEGDIIDSLYDKPLCWKYLTKREKQYINELNNPIEPKKKKQTFTDKYFDRILNPIKKFFTPKVIDSQFLEKHIDTPQLVYHMPFKEGDNLNFTLKMHGTSGRTGLLRWRFRSNILTKDYWNNTLNSNISYFGLVKEYDKYIEQTGSRRQMVFDTFKKTKVSKGYYDNNFRFDIHNELIDKLSYGMQIYYEIVGDISLDSPIMPPHHLDGKVYTYSYGVPEGQYDFYIYRINYTDSDDKIYEYSFDELVEFCEGNNLNYCPSLYNCVYDGNINSIKQIVKELFDKYSMNDPLNPSGIMEGIIIRNDNLYKCDYVKLKTPPFCEAEEIQSKSELFLDMENVS